MATKAQRKEGSWDAGRVLQALGRIGYRPVYALLDIADNSLSAGATKIAINVVTTRDPDQEKGRPRAILSSFSVVDNGFGMDEAGLANALTLGSSESNYTEGTLAKFGLGLKSAAFSLGDRLEIISKQPEDDTVRKVVLDCQEIIKANGEYFYTLESPNKQDLDELKAQGDSGTIVRITKTHIASMPRASEIIEELVNGAGVVYYYYLSRKVSEKQSLEMTINSMSDGDIDETIQITPVDPLFVDEAQDNLDETSWDGITVQWITKPKSIQLDLEGNAYADLEITQLPHPPSVAQATGEKKEQKACRDKYLIGAGNYGIYIYRNYRLISWADQLEGLVPRNKNLYAFRGRILIRSEADDLLNIDVTKSRIQLSEIAFDNLLPEIDEAKSKSQKAWKHRTEVLKGLLAGGAQEQVNEELNRVEVLIERDDRLDEEVAPPDEKHTLETRRKEAIKRKPASNQEAQLLRDEGQRHQLVDHLDNDQLWERAHDAECGLYVRINKRHRFFREVILIQEENEGLTKALAILLFGLARGEYNLVYKSDTDHNLCESILQEFRERVGTELSEIVRYLDTVALFDDNE